MTGKSLDQILERCLQEMCEDRDIDTIVEDYPRDDAYLRSLLEIATAVSDYYSLVPDPPGGLATGRRRLLDEASQNSGRLSSVPIPTRRAKRRPLMKLAFAKLISILAATVIGTTVIGGGVALAARESVPGQALYPVKLMVEDVQLGLASSANTQVDLALGFADERVAEIKALEENDQPVPENVAQRMEQHLQHALNQAAWASEEEMPGLLQQIAQRTQIQGQALEQMQLRVRQQTQTQIETALQACQQTRTQAAAGLADPQTFRWRQQHQDSMPEDVTPPEPPEPTAPAGTPHKPDDAGQNQSETPEGDQEQTRDQERSRDQEGDQDQKQEQEQEQNQEQNQDQEQNQEQNQQDQGQTPQDPATPPQGGSSDNEARGDGTGQGGEGSGGSNGRP